MQRKLIFLIVLAAIVAFALYSAYSKGEFGENTPVTSSCKQFSGLHHGDMSACTMAQATPSTISMNQLGLDTPGVSRDDPHIQFPALPPTGAAECPSLSQYFDTTDGLCKQRPEITQGYSRIGRQCVGGRQADGSYCLRSGYKHYRDTCSPALDGSP